MGKNIKILLLLIFYFIAFPLQGQNHYLLSSFEAIKDNNRIILQWTIKQGGSCFGIGIFRSNNDQNFALIGEILGNCGSTEFDQKYTYIDESPLKNTSNFYVLELGFSGKTVPPVEVEFFDLEKKSSLVFPNPSSRSNDVQIVFRNSNLSKHFLKVYNSHGKLILTESSDLDYFLLSQELPVETNINKSNTYYYSIFDEKNIFVTSGLFIRI